MCTMANLAACQTESDYSARVEKVNVRCSNDHAHMIEHVGKAHNIRERCIVSFVFVALFLICTERLFTLVAGQACKP